MRFRADLLAQSGPVRDLLTRLGSFTPGATSHSVGGSRRDWTFHRSGVCLSRRLGPAVPDADMDAVVYPCRDCFPGRDRYVWANLVMLLSNLAWVEADLPVLADADAETYPQMGEPERRKLMTRLARAATLFGDSPAVLRPGRDGHWADRELDDLRAAVPTDPAICDLLPGLVDYHDRLLPAWHQVAARRLATTAVYAWLRHVGRDLGEPRWAVAGAPAQAFLPDDKAAVAWLHEAEVVAAVGHRVALVAPAAVLDHLGVFPESVCPVVPGTDAETLGHALALLDWPDGRETLAEMVEALRAASLPTGP